MKQYNRLLMVIGIFVIFFGVVALLDAKGLAAFGDEFPETEVLTYIASRENVPVEYLEIAYVTQTHFELLGRDFWAVKVTSSSNEQVYGVWVDMRDGSFVDDIETIRQAEKEAYRAQYGKLEVALYERQFSTNWLLTSSSASSNMIVPEVHSISCL